VTADFRFGSKHMTSNFLGPVKWNQWSHIFKFLYYSTFIQRNVSQLQSFCDQHITVKSSWHVMCVSTYHKHIKNSTSHSFYVTNPLRQSGWRSHTCHELNQSAIFHELYTESGWRSHTCVHPHITNISKAPRVIHDMSRTLYYSRVGVVTRCSVQNTTLVSCLAACRPSCLVYVTHTHMHTHTHTHTHVRV